VDEAAVPTEPATSGAPATSVRACAIDEDVVEDALAWLNAGKRVAVATVIRISGSAPRPAGSQLAVNDDMAFVGSVSGGCVEASTVQAALDVMRDGRPRRLSFGAGYSSPLEVGLTCGGDIELYVESVTGERRLLEELSDARAERRSLVVATALARGRRFLLPCEGVPVGGDPELAADARRAALADRSTLIERDGTQWFLHVRHPSRRLVIVGAVHIAQALVPIAALNGFEVVLVDPRSAFLTRSRFPSVELVDRWPHEIMSELAIDHRTAVVTLAHDPKLDDPALAFAARSPAFYVGALGSRRAHEARLERLSAMGLSREARSRIRGPVGLPIGALTVSEIATSIVAEMVQTLRQGAH
jgi:xanthine dehydrogenase accessory factor